jgi:hypothetical protein
MGESILFVVEGVNPEKQVLSSIGKQFFEDKLIHVAYEAEVYQLGKLLSDDPYLDLFEVLKERSEKNSQVLAEFNRDDFSQIYLFFDYEGQAANASDTALDDMLAHFTNETESGKLYVSYPMVEALKHLNRSDPFEDCAVPAGITGAEYKPLVGKHLDFQDLRKVTAADWQFIIRENIKKANLIAEGAYCIPPTLPNQRKLLDGQIQRYKTPLGNIAVLSAFPLFLRDYFGESILA